MDYKRLDELLQGRCKDRRKLDRNTYAERRDECCIAIRLHATDILTFYPDRVVVNVGRWTTPTTKQRLNSFLPALHIDQRKGTWYWTDKKSTPFSNGDEIQLPPDGTHFLVSKYVLTARDLEGRAKELRHGGDHVSAAQIEMEAAALRAIAEEEDQPKPVAPDLTERVANEKAIKKYARLCAETFFENAAELDEHCPECSAFREKIGYKYGQRTLALWNGDSFHSDEYSKHLDECVRSGVPHPHIVATAVCTTGCSQCMLDHVFHGSSAHPLGEKDLAKYIYKHISHCCGKMVAV